jgi:hypothetical protein
MADRESTGKPETEKDKVVLPKVKPGVQGGLGQWAWVQGGLDDVKRKLDDLKQKAKRSKDSN